MTKCENENIRKGASNKSAYVPSLTALRGITSLLVVFSHMGVYGYYAPLYFGGIGGVSVAVFFSLSGFLMAFLYLEKKSDFLNVNKFIISRISRVAPAYLFAGFLSYILFSFDSNFPFAMDLFSLFRHVLFMGSVGVFWSIPPEVQFYLVFIVFWVLWSCSVILGSAFLILFTIVGLVFFADSPGIIVFSKVAFFFSGVLVALLRGYLGMLMGKFGMFLIIIVSLISLGVYRFSEISSDADFWSWGLGWIFSSYIVAVFYVRGHLFENKVGLLFEYLGRWSFSLYLLHVPVLYYSSKFMPENFVSSLLALGMCVFVSYFSYRYIEVRFGDYVRRFLMSKLKF